MTIHNTLGNNATESHGPLWQTVANAAALTALTIAAGDVSQRKLILQTDTGQLWVCTAAGTPGTFQEVARTATTLDKFAAPVAAVAMGGQEVTNVGTPTAAASATRRSDVDLVTVAVAACTTAALPTYTTSGGPGAGFTLTASANGAFPTLDANATVTAAASGEPISARFLFQNGAAATDNGVYVLTQQGSAGAPWIAVRYTGLDTATKIPGSKIRVQAGAQSGGGEYFYKAIGTITMGTTQLFWKRIDPQRSWNEGNYFYEDFATPVGSAAANGFIPGGSGLINLINATGTQTVTTTNSAALVGVYNWATGAGATTMVGVCDSWVSVATQPDGGGCFIPAQGIDYVFETHIAVPTLSTGTQEFCINAGWTKQRNASQKSPADGILFVYDRTSATSSTNWLAMVSSGGVGTAGVDTGVAVNAGQFYRLRIEHDAGSTGIRFYIDGTLVATITTNIPSATLLGLMVVAFKSVGTGSVNALQIDSVVKDIFYPARKAA